MELHDLELFEKCVYPAWFQADCLNRFRERSVKVLFMVPLERTFANSDNSIYQQTHEFRYTRCSNRGLLFKCKYSLSGKGVAFYVILEGPLLTAYVFLFMSTIFEECSKL